jgi:DNA-directed RNA polymerase subunit E'/Rpb7
MTEKDIGLQLHEKNKVNKSVDSLQQAIAEIFSVKKSEVSITTYESSDLKERKNKVFGFQILNVFYTVLKWYPADEEIVISEIRIKDTGKKIGTSLFPHFVQFANDINAKKMVAEAIVNQRLFNKLLDIGFEQDGNSNTLFIGLNK